MKEKRSGFPPTSRSAGSGAGRRTLLTDGKGTYIGLEILDGRRGRVVESNLVRAGTVLRLPTGIAWSEASRYVRGRTALVPQELAGRILSDRSERPPAPELGHVDPETYED